MNTNEQNPAPTSDNKTAFDTIPTPRVDSVASCFYTEGTECIPADLGRDIEKEIIQLGESFGNPCPRCSRLTYIEGPEQVCWCCRNFDADKRIEFMEGFEKFQTSSLMADTGDYIVGWDSDKLRALFDADDRNSMVERIDAHTWELLGKQDELQLDNATLRAQVAKMDGHGAHIMSGKCPICGNDLNQIGACPICPDLRHPTPGQIATDFRTCPNCMGRSLGSDGNSCCICKGTGLRSI